MAQMCRGCPDVNKHRGMNAAILRQHRPFMSIKSFVQHSGWQEMVSLCSLIRLIGVCADHDWWPARVPLFSLGPKVPRSPCGHSGRLLTHYRQREVRNSIYRYRKIHIDYRSKFSYRFYIDYIDNLRQHYHYVYWMTSITTRILFAIPSRGKKSFCWHHTLARYCEWYRKLIRSYN